MGENQQVVPETGRDERRFDRGAWLTLAVLLGWVGGMLFLIATGFIYPTDGWSYDWDDSWGPYTTTDYIGEAATPLNSGDLILGIEGQLFAPGSLPSFPPGLEEGDVVDYTVQRDRQIMHLEVTLARLGFAGYLRSTGLHIRNSLELFIPSLFSFLIAGLVFFLRPGNLGARYLVLFFGYYFLTNFGGSTSSLYVYSMPVFPQFLDGFLTAYSWFWFFFPTLILLGLAFPVVKLPLRRYPRGIHGVVYGIPMATIGAFYAYTILTRDTRFEILVIPVGMLTISAALVSLFGSLIHNWLTLRDPRERAQLRWVALGLGMGLGLPLTLFFLLVLIYGEVPAGVLDFAFWLFLLVPISIGIAITRYRLFDIDLIIRRTLLYSMLTVLLGLVYFGIVVFLQELFGRIGGQANSPLAIVISTLVIAALLGPLRLRLQNFIDRRFFRQKYNAEQALEEYTQAARNEVEMEQLTSGLVSTVQKTMQPQSVTLWIKK